MDSQLGVEELCWSAPKPGGTSLGWIAAKTTSRNKLTFPKKNKLKFCPKEFKLFKMQTLGFCFLI